MTLERFFFGWVSDRRRNFRIELHAGRYPTFCLELMNGWRPHFLLIALTPRRYLKWGV